MNKSKNGTIYRLEVSRSTKLITLTSMAILAVFGVYCILSGKRETIIFSVLALAVFLLFLMMPRYLAVDGCTVTVKRVFGETRIKLSVEEIETLEELGRGLLFGSAGLFGWYGVFVVRGETALVYSRREKKLTLVKSGGRNYVFGVSDEGFINYLKTCCSQRVE